MVVLGWVIFRFIVGSEPGRRSIALLGATDGVSSMNRLGRLRGRTGTKMTVL